MLLNVVVLILFAINFTLRLAMYREAALVPVAPLVLSIVGTLVLVVSAYLGGRMVYAYGINVARLSKGKWRKVAESAGAQADTDMLTRALRALDATAQRWNRLKWKFLQQEQMLVLVAPFTVTGVSTTAGGTTITTSVAADLSPPPQAARLGHCPYHRP